MGKFLSILILASAVFAGAAMYYLQVYHFYEEVTPTGDGDVMLTAQDTLAAEPLTHSEFRAIDANSSPIRYRACFATSESLAELAGRYAPYADAVPLEAPGWFDCFEADVIGAALESGQAQAFLSEANIIYGIDRIVAITEDGRGYAWHQINPCGEKVFDGEPVPEGCPAPPQGN